MLSSLDLALPVLAFTIPVGIIGYVVYMDRRKTAVVTQRNAKVAAETARVTPTSVSPFGAPTPVTPVPVVPSHDAVEAGSIETAPVEVPAPAPTTVTDAPKA